MGEASVFFLFFSIEDVTSLSADVGSALLLVLTPEILFLGILIILFIKCVVC